MVDLVILFAILMLFGVLGFFNYLLWIVGAILLAIWLIGLLAGDYFDLNA